jgi:glycosyltransferase involved in cell wall biosynthesis
MRRGKVIKSRPTVIVSCAMIVRDAESTIVRALESVRPHVDELVIVDTGSVDRTIEFARHYADTLVDAEWIDDFSISRQHAYDLCTGDWVMHLDADDELHGGEHLRAGLSALSADIGAIHWRYVTGRDPHGVVTTEFWRERCTRAGWYRWVGAVHEVLIPNHVDRVAREESIWVEHHGHGDGTASLQRNVRILEATIEASQTPDPRLLFYAGRDLVALGELERGLMMLSRYLLVATWTDERYIAQLLVGYVYRCRKDYSRAIDADLAALKVTPAWPGAYFALAEDCYYLEQWERVLHWSRIGQSLPPPDSALFTHPADYQYGWMIYEAVALSKLGRIEEAAELTVRALRYAPDNPMHLHNAAFFTAELARQAG